MNYEKLNPEKYITPQEIADYLHINVKAARAYFIKGKRVDYIKIGHKFMVLRSSFLEWEASTRTKATKMW